jgi:hypothetical protein
MHKLSSSPINQIIPSQAMYPVEGENAGEMKELNVRVYDNINAGDMECPFCKRMATDWCIIAIESVDEKKVIIKSEPIYLCISCLVSPERENKRDFL